MKPIEGKKKRIKGTVNWGKGEWWTMFSGAKGPIYFCGLESLYKLSSNCTVYL